MQTHNIFDIIWVNFNFIIQIHQVDCFFCDEYILTLYMCSSNTIHLRYEKINCADMKILISSNLLRLRCEEAFARMPGSLLKVFTIYVYLPGLCDLSDCERLFRRRRDGFHPSAGWHGYDCGSRKAFESKRKIKFLKLFFNSSSFMAGNNIFYYVVITNTKAKCCVFLPQQSIIKYSQLVCMTSDYTNTTWNLNNQRL